MSSAKPASPAGVQESKFAKYISLFTVSGCRLEERAEDGSGKESGTLEMISERQKELRVALLGMEARVGRPNIMAFHKSLSGGKALGRR